MLRSQGPLFRPHEVVLALVSAAVVAIMTGLSLVY